MKSNYASIALKHRLKLRHDQEAGMALMSVLLLMLVITMLSVLVLGLVMSQVRPTLFTNKNTRTIAAAQAGIDTAVSQIRNSTQDLGNADLPMGDIRKLPCFVSGAVESSASSAIFSAEVQYFSDNPEGQDSDWITDNELECETTGALTGTGRDVPYYALVTSVGEDPSSVAMSDIGDRTLQATYTFPLTTRTISGGQIRDNNGTLCLAAESAETGKRLVFRPITSAWCVENKHLSSWTWGTDYMLRLSSTELSGQPLCVSGRNSSSNPRDMTLQTCHVTDNKDPDGQRFSWEGVHTWQGQDAQNRQQINSFIVVRGGDNRRAESGDTLAVRNSTSGYAVPVPHSSVGKGNASAATNQVVNQFYFGRCFDLTGQEVNANFMITYPCKQDPSGAGNVFWNHKWYYIEPQLSDGSNSLTTKIVLRKPNGASYTEYCLYSTNSMTTPVGLSWPDGSSAAGYYPRVGLLSSAVCRDSNRASMWTRHTATGDESTEWTFVDYTGKCLSTRGPSDPDGWNAVPVETCEGNDYQKWNVPDDPTLGLIGDYRELVDSE